MATVASARRLRREAMHAEREKKIGTGIGTGVGTAGSPGKISGDLEFGQKRIRNNLNSATKQDFEIIFSE